MNKNFIQNSHVELLLSVRDEMKSLKTPLEVWNKLDEYIKDKLISLFCQEKAKCCLSLPYPWETEPRECLLSAVLK